MIATPLIRPARSADLDAIADLQDSAIMAIGAEIYDRRTLEAWATLGRQIRHTLLGTGTFFVAESAGALLGVAGWTRDSREADAAWARCVFVRPDAAGRGLGRKLMNAIERSVAGAGHGRLLLWASLNAVGFYEALGYRKVKPARWPIGGGIDMEHLLMEKTLGGIEGC